MRRPGRLAAVAAFAALLVPAHTAATSLPDGFFEDVVARSLNIPTSFAFLPDGRIVIAEKDGVVRLVKDGEVVPAPLVDLRGRVNSYGDRGLTAVAADPDFDTNGYLYLYYAYEDDAARPERPKSARLVRLTVDGDHADPASEVVLVGTESTGSCNAVRPGADCIPADADHMGGSIRFASDETIFLSTGDGAASGTPNGNALRSQSLTSLGGSSCG